MSVINRNVHPRFITVIGCTVMNLVRLRLKCTSIRSVSTRGTLRCCSGRTGRSLRLVLGGGRSCSRT